MKRYFLIGILTILFCLMAVCPASAASVYMVDGAELLSPQEAATLNGTLSEISARHGANVVIVTTNDVNGKTAEEYADDYFDYNGYGPDGILLLVAMDIRQMHISTSGYGITAFTDAGLDYLLDKLEFWVQDGYYTEGFSEFATLADSFLTQAETGEPYDTHNLPKEPFSAGASLLLALAVGFIASFIITGKEKAKLHTVRPQQNAAQYVNEDTFTLDPNRSREFFLYKNITRTVKAETSSGGGSTTHKSSSGNTHGGAGRSF